MSGYILLALVIVTALALSGADAADPFTSTSTESSGCFPGHATVRTQDGQRVALSDLSLGDIILALDVSTGLPVYSEVIAFLHASKYVPQNSPFIRIATEDGVTITLTPDHLIYVADSEPEIFSAQARYAASIKPGDYIFSVYSSGENISASKVLEVVDEICSGCGFYAPLTMAGTIVVDHAIASCYASISSQALADATMTPIRLAHSIMTALHVPLNAFSSVMYSSAGVHRYAEFLESIGGYLLPKDMLY